MTAPTTAKSLRRPITDAERAEAQKEVAGLQWLKERGYVSSIEGRVLSETNDAGEIVAEIHYVALPPLDNVKGPVGLIAYEVTGQGDAAVVLTAKQITAISAPPVTVPYDAVRASIADTLDSKRTTRANLGPSWEPTGFAAQIDAIPGVQLDREQAKRINALFAEAVAAEQAANLERIAALEAKVEALHFDLQYPGDEA